MNVTACRPGGGTPGVAIAFSFPFGRYHATAAGTGANQGIVEWPPSPWRVLRTLYSVWKTRCADLDEQVVTRLLERLATPPQYFVTTRTAAGHSRHYMPVNVGAAEKTILVHDAFVTVARPAGRHAAAGDGGADAATDSPLVVCWPDVELDADERAALTHLCAAITWLGRADSLADATAHFDGVRFLTPNSYLVPDTASDTGDSPIHLLVPTLPLDFESLTTRPSDARSTAKNRSTTPRGASFRWFVRPTPERPRAATRRRAPRRPTAVRFSLVPNEKGRSATRLPIADAVVHTSALRSAALRSYSRRTSGEISTSLSGRVARDDASGFNPATGHGHAHYLAIPGDGTAEPADRVVEFVVWAPDGFDPDDVDALLSTSAIKGFPWFPGSRRFRVKADGVGDPAELVPDFCGRSTRWTTVTPVVPGRHPKGTIGWDEHIRAEILADCAARGLPEPRVDIRQWPGPRVTTVRPRPGRESHRAQPRPVDVTVTFDAMLERPQPLCLGALSHFGLGLFTPRRPR